jgi:ribosomal protein L17
VQRQSRKILGHIQTTEAQYRADNISHLADHLTGAGIAKRFAGSRNRPSTCGSRLNDNSLIGCVYKRVMSYFEQERFAGFHRLTHGDPREI